MRWDHHPFGRWPHLAHHYRRIETLQREIIEAQQQQPRVDTRLPWQTHMVLVLLIILAVVIMLLSTPAPSYYW